MKKNQQYFFGVLYILLAAVFWGTGGVLSKLISGNAISPIFSTSIRLLVAAGIMQVVALVQRKQVPTIRIKHLPLFSIYVLVGVVLYNVLYFSAYLFLPVAAVIVLYYTNPLMLVLYAKYILRHQIPFMNVLISMGIVLGVLLTLDITQLRNVNIIGVILALGSAAAFMFYTLIGKQLAEWYSSETLVRDGFVAGGVILLAIAAATRSLPAQLSSNDVLLLFLFGLLPAFMAFLLFNKGLHRVSATTASIIASSETLFASILGFFVLGEQLSFLQMLGIAIVFGVIAYKNANHTQLRVRTKTISRKKTS